MFREITQERWDSMSLKNFLVCWTAGNKTSWWWTETTVGQWNLTRCPSPLLAWVSVIFQYIRKYLVCRSKYTYRLLDTLTLCLVLVLDRISFCLQKYQTTSWKVLEILLWDFGSILTWKLYVIATDLQGLSSMVVWKFLFHWYLGTVEPFELPCSGNQFNINFVALHVIDKACHYKMILCCP